MRRYFGSVEQFAKDLGHLKDGFAVTALVPVQHQCHDAADIEQTAFVGIVGPSVHEVAEFIFFLGGIVHHPLYQKHGEIIPQQRIQKNVFFLPVPEEPLINDLNGLVVVVVGQVERCTVEDRMIQQGTQAAFLAAEVTVEGFSGDSGPVADVADGDLRVAFCKHQFLQTLLQLPLPLGTFLGCAIFIHISSIRRILLHIS